MRKAKFEVWKSMSGEWFFHLKSPNGKLIADSEGYSRKGNALRGIEAVKKYAVNAKIVEEGM